MFCLLIALVMVDRTWPVEPNILVAGPKESKKKYLLFVLNLPVETCLIA